jgi:alkylation response protein AidB-like acyl-CoA dehydrogenase
MEVEVAPIINQYWEKAEFPHQLLPKLGALGIGGCNQQGNGCSGHSLMKEGLIIMELARVDPSISLCFLVHDSLCMYTIGALGNEAQKVLYMYNYSRQYKISNAFAIEK